MKKIIQLTAIGAFFVGLIIVFAVFFVQTTGISGKWNIASPDGEILEADFRLVTSNGAFSGFEAQGELEIIRNGKSVIYTPSSACKNSNSFEIWLSDKSGEAGEIRAVFDPSLKEFVLYYDDMNYYAGPADCSPEAEDIIERLGA